MPENDSQTTVARCLIGGEPISDARIGAKIETLSETLNERESLEKLGYLYRHPLDGGPPVDMTPTYGP